MLSSSDGGVAHGLDAIVGAHERDCAMVSRNMSSDRVALGLWCQQGLRRRPGHHLGQQPSSPRPATGVEALSTDR
jgi:hypothetical protein